MRPSESKIQNPKSKIDMTPLKQPARWQVGLILATGILAISTAAILIRLSFQAAGIRTVGFSLVLAASRLTAAALILLPAWRSVQWSAPGGRTDATRRSILYAGGAGIVLALHFAAWITSLSYTSIAASTTLVTTNPVWVALLSWIWFKEKPSRLQAAGIAVALAGGISIGLADAGALGAGSNPLLGDFLALAGSWAISLYLLLGREAQRLGMGIGGYAAVAYSTAAVALLPLPLAFSAGYTGYPREVYLYILLMAIFPQLVGHTSFNWAVRWVSPTFVTLAILFEPVASSILGYFVFGEVPAPAVLAGAAVLLAGVAIAASAGKQQSP